MSFSLLIQLVCFSSLFRFRGRIPCTAGLLAMGTSGTARTTSAAAGALPSAHPAKLASYNKKYDDGKYGNDNEIGHICLSFLNLTLLRPPILCRLSSISYAVRIIGIHLLFLESFSFTV